MFMSKPSSASEKRPKALFVSPECPYPAVGGGALRSASLLEYLCAAYDTDLILFEQNGAPDPQSRIPPGKVRRSRTIWLPHHSKGSVARGIRNLLRLVRNRPPLLDRFAGFEADIGEFVGESSYDLAVVEHFWCAPYLAQLRPFSKVIWLDLHNIESEWHQSVARSSDKILAAIHKHFAQCCLEQERLWLPKFDLLLVTSVQDAERLRRIAPDSKSIVYPNALPLSTPLERERKDVVAFSGNLEYEPNRMAVRYFFREIWPALRHEWPAVKWRIIGKNPHAVANIVAEDTRIELAGPVEDAVAELAQAKVAVVPLLAGSGTRVKILEAWAAATAVVSTSVGAEGLECRNGQHLLIADDPLQFAKRVSELLSCEEKRVQIGECGRALYVERYTWNAAWRLLGGGVAAR